MNRTLRRVLIVDDNEDDREWFARLLTDDARVRYEFVGGESVTDAVAKSLVTSIDFIIADWGLTDGSPLDLLRTLRERGDHTPVLVVTGGEAPDRFADALRGGAVDFLRKDALNAESLHRAVEHSLVRASLERELARARDAANSAMERERSARQAAERALAEVARSRAFLTRLQVVNAALADALTVDEVARTVVEHAGVFEGAQAGSIYLVENQKLVLRGYFGFAEEDVERWQLLDLSMSTPITESARRAAQVVVASESEFARRYAGLPRPSAGAWVATPILSEREVIGCIGLRYPAEHPFEDDSLAFISLVADAIMQGLVRARFVHELSERAELEHRLLAVIGHDLRTPLSAISMASSLLRQDVPNNDLVVRIERSAARMKAIINDLMSRNEVRARAEEHARADDASLDAIVADQVEELRAAFPLREIEFENRGANATRANSPRASQIVANLVRNALQHGAEGLPVRVALEADDGGVLLTVRNGGRPVPAEQLPHLFDPFRRGAGAHGAGSGLGLFIVRECAEACGATIHVRSDADATEFAVRFPSAGRLSSGRSSLYPAAN